MWTLRQRGPDWTPITPKAGSLFHADQQLGGGVASHDAQNAYMVLAYIKSRALLEDLGGAAYFERIFSEGDIDAFSRLAPGASLEEIWKYWLGHLSASVENISGVLTVRLDAFRPEHAQRSVQDIVRLSEALVNKVTLRNRADSLARAETEVAGARERLALARQKTLEFRNKNLVIDPGARATSIGELIGKLSMERIDLVNALSTFSSSLATDAPSQRLQRTRLAAVEKQIAELRRKLTDDQGSGAVSEQLANYENLKLDEQFAERLYSIALTAYDSARQDLERQQLYLVTIVPPTLPESATYPRVVANTSLLFFALLGAWAIVALIVASIDDQMT
ncbi:capsule polysaccharide export inner-membrane protein CtrB [Methylocystis echinoides]|uniref:Capsule polysaccharide export inner-membrane protein CtrB n=1 Tax=Methylocystis echinoides TaxID=29468 RepID=A0A9W6GRK3_9HYPH|nr:capsule polysaccharide export inner-membrane protein CtrB [Methylocystis echinoides]